MKKRASFVRNAWTSYAIRALLGVSALILTPYIYRSLGGDGFGTWSVMLTLITVLSLVEYGFVAGISKFVAEHRGREDEEALRATMGASVAVMAGLGVVAALIAVLAGELLDGLAAEAYRDEFRTGMLLIGAGMLFRFPLAAYLGGLEGYQRFDLGNVSWGIVALVFAIGAVISIETGADVAGLAAAHGLSLVVGGLVFAYHMRRVAPGLPLRPHLGNRGQIRQVLGFGSLTTLADSMAFIGQRMDVVVIAAIRDAATAAPFAAAVKLQTGVQSLVIPWVEILMPMVSELWARGERQEVARRLALATRVALQLTLPVALALALFAHDVVDLWLGDVAPAVTVDIVVLLALVQIATLTSAPAEKALVGMGRVRAVGVLASVEGIANLGLSVILVTSYGAIGAAIGTLVTAATLGPLRVPLAVRSIGEGSGRLLRDGVVRAVLSSLPAAVLMVAVALAMDPGALRLIVGWGLGLGAAVLVAAQQIGPGRITAAIRARRAAPGVPTVAET